VVRIEGCNSPFMKVESLVIVNQHVTVNGGEPCTHRPSRQGRSIGWKLYDSVDHRLTLKKFEANLFYIVNKERQSINRDEVVTR